MRNLKTYDQFRLNEGFTITKDKLPKVGDVVDKIVYKDGDRIAFVDFKGVKNIPIHIVDNGGDVMSDKVAEPTVSVA